MVFVRTHNYEGYKTTLSSFLFPNNKHALSDSH